MEGQGVGSGLGMASGTDLKTVLRVTATKSLRHKYQGQKPVKRFDSEDQKKGTVSFRTTVFSS